MINNIISPKFHFLILLLFSPQTVDCSDDLLTFSIGRVKNNPIGWLRVCAY